MKKWLIGLIVCVVLAAIIISGIIVYFLKPKQNWKIYENKDWGFRIKYPDGCEVSEEKKVAPTFPDFEVKFEKPLGESKGSWELSVFVSTFPPIKEEETPYKRAKVFLGLAKEIYPETKFHEFKNSTLDGLPSMRIVYSCHQVKYLHETTIRNGVLYGLVYRVWENQELYDKYLLIIEEMINSFEFI
jgi:hypothetical protein